MSRSNASWRRSGTLKVYIGAAPGVGNTYTMLREANELKKQGIDVAIGLLETHSRQETIEQMGELDIIMWSSLIIPWLTLYFMKKEYIKRFMPVAIFVSLLVTILFEIAYTFKWWVLLD